ncbi:Metallo-dependent phosphatase-like protein [Suillus subaureus]|uniref:Double-strand break repair protein n=1 Tax=Suillus subaureus TaxID=48587 RepID=A0A9P7E0G5_9AGAM|nr:Metallo-dependent phosphatase-like protein [Suillus subaureus]KAG1807498.1 Metallo-dependent phosphatase-like protein [Suillus subaureus]
MSDNEAPPATTRNAYQEDIIKILVATDNHIGYLERDPIRGQDSINTFKEILQLAVKHDVDMILLGGDLFHENRPSRDCLYQVMALLREYTLGDKPVQLELLSNPDDGQAEGYSFPAVNYEDPNLNVAIPVFSIHGNHDDPQGAGPQGALWLINYMGKFDLPLSSASNPNPVENDSGISIRPVLLRKGQTRLGLYGVGNVKDARMHFELRSNRVRMYMPGDKEDWFNVLVVHQNRVPHPPTPAVPEGLFDDCIDLVVWGHEHDCRIVPEPVAGRPYHITQPGSSVATSLGEGEGLEKHVALLQIHNKEFELKPLPLRTVRPFMLGDIFLAEAAEEEGFDVSDQIAVGKFLRARVNALIDQANQLWDERNAHAVEEGEVELPRMLPLVRLKVDTTNVPAMSNPIRFGQEFTGRIANPRDVLSFHRSKARSSASRTATSVDQPELSIDDPDLTTSEKLAKVRVQTLVQEYLAAQELQVLGEAGMNEAIRMFVEKDDGWAIQTHVSSALRALMKGVQENGEVDEEELDDVLVKLKEQHNQEYLEKAKMGKTGKGKGKEKASAADSDADSMLMDVDIGEEDGSDFDEPVPPPKKRKLHPRKRLHQQRRGGGKRLLLESEEVTELDENDDEEDEAPPKVTKRTNRAAVLSQPAKKAPAKKTTTTQGKASSSGQGTLSFAPSGRSSTRTAAARAKGKMANVVEVDSD